MVISDNGASAEGGADRLAQRDAVLQQRPGDARGQPRRASTSWAARPSFNHYAWGWTWAGNTPFRRWKRETYRGGTTDPFIVAWPAGISARGEIRTQYAHIDRHGADRARRARHRAAGHRSAVCTQAPIEGVSFAAHLRRRRTRRPGTTRSTSRCSATAPSTTTAGARSARGPAPNFTEAAQKGRKLGDPITAEVLDELDANDWELYDLTDDYAETARRRRRAPRTRCIELVGRWWDGGRQVQRAADRRLAARSGWRRAPADRPGPRPLHLLPGTRWCRPPSPRRVYNRPFSITADVEIPTGGAEGVLICPGRRRRRLLLLRQGRPAALRLQLRRTRPLSGRPRPSTGRPRAVTRCATSSSPPASPTSPSGKGARDAASSTSTASWSGRPTCLSRPPSRSAPVA